MRISLASLIASLVMTMSLSWSGYSQSSTGTIFGTIADPNAAVISGAIVTAKNTATGFSRMTTTDSAGAYRLADIPTGTYELTIEASNFSKHFRTGITLDAAQSVRVDAVLIAGNIQAEVVIKENASMLNSTTAEVSTRFDSRRLSEVPSASNRSVFNILLSAPGISQRTGGQTAFALGISFSANGGRIRSNSFILDGQDMNDPALGGSQMALNNPDAIQEVRLVTNQFLPEYGHNAGSVVEIVGRGGTNNLRGSAFWFHNNENLNACSNTDKRAGFCDPSSQVGSVTKAPYRRENQYGFTLGGPVFFPRFGEGGPYFYNGKGKTFFFVDYQRWSDRRTPSLTIRGAPTQAGRDLLQPFAATRPQVAALLRFIPAGIANGQSATVVVNGGSFVVPLGDLTSSANYAFDSDQGSFRIDHAPDEKNLIYARYRYSYESTRRAAQINPPGHGTLVDLSVLAGAVVWKSSFSPTASNEVRVGWKRLDLARDAEDRSAYTIPAIQIIDLGLDGVPEAETRTAFGLPTNLPVFRTSDTYELADSVSIFKVGHTVKLGAEFRRATEASELFSLNRGSLRYSDLNKFVRDEPDNGSRGFPVPGSDVTQSYKWHEAYFYVQDQWRIRSNLTLLYGVRYEYPGNSFRYLREVNKRILAANNNDPEFRFEPYPKADLNNWMPRLGFGWNPRVKGKGIAGLITGGNKLVVRAGYARSYDPWVVNINQNTYTSFPFTAMQAFRSYDALVHATAPTTTTRMLTRIIPAPDFRSPATDQISFDVQRELTADLLLRVGYVRTRGTALFQNVQGNPPVQCLFGTGPGLCNTTGIDRNSGLPSTSPPPPVKRVDETRGIISLRANSASSTYDALQVSLEKRLSRGLSFGLHYTWSALIDTASDFFSPSVAEAGTSQDPFDRNADRGRGSYDRPQRLTGNVVYELPYFSKQKGLVGKLLGGWQISSFLNFQSGAPFSPQLASDPTGANNAVRPNLFTDLDLSGMSVAQLYQLERQLRARAYTEALQIFNSAAPGLCGWLGGTPLPVTLFTSPRGRVVCENGKRNLVVDYLGILEGQRVGNAGRNILRADGLRLVDFGVIKNTKLTENVRVQFWTDFFNVFNERNFGIPSGVITAADFLDQWATDGGSRRIRLGARIVF